MPKDTVQLIFNRKIIVKIIFHPVKKLIQSFWAGEPE